MNLAGDAEIRETRVSARAQALRGVSGRKSDVTASIRIDISIKKAWTLRAFDIQTKDLGDNAQSTQQFYGIHGTNDGKVIIFAGGVPLERDGAVIGGLGVSGGSGEQDQTIAEAGLAVLQQPA